MLGVAVGIVPDVGDVANIDSEQHKLTRDRLPAEVSLDCRGVMLLYIGISLGADGTAHHDLGLGGATGYDAVYQNPRVAAEVTCLGRGGHHRQPELAVHDQR